MFHVIQAGYRYRCNQTRVLLKFKTETVSQRRTTALARAPPSPAMALRDESDDDDDDESDGAFDDALTSPVMATVNGSRKDGTMKMNKSKNARARPSTTSTTTTTTTTVSGVGGLDLDVDDGFNFSEALKKRKVDVKSPRQGASGGARKRGGVSAAAASGRRDSNHEKENKENKKGSIAWLLEEQAHDAQAAKLAQVVMERRKADDAILRAQRERENEEMKREIAREEEEAMRAIEREHNSEEIGETIVVCESKCTLTADAFVNARSPEVLETQVTFDAVDDFTDFTERTGKEPGSCHFGYDQFNEDVKVVMLLEGFMPLMWLKRRANGERNVVLKSDLTWLWSMVRNFASRDVGCAARDAILVALGFDAKLGSLYDGELSRFDYTRKKFRERYDAPAWSPSATEACEALESLGAQITSDQATQSSKPVGTNLKTFRLRPDFFIMLQVITAYCDNAFVRAAEFDRSADACAKLLQLYASIVIDPRTRALDVVVEQAAASLLACISDAQWSAFKANAVKRLTELTGEDEYAIKLRITQWLPCTTHRERDMRDALAAAAIVSLQHKIPRADGKKTEPVKLTAKLASDISRDDAQSILNRRRDAAEQIADARLDSKLEAPDVWRLVYVMDLVDIVLNGGIVIEGEDLFPEGGLERFMQFLSTKLPRTFRPSLSALKTKLWAVKTRYERIGDVTRAAIQAAKDAVYHV